MPYNQPFAEQVAFFRQKLNLPTERWDDIWQAQHDRSFIVAGAQSADMLADFRQAVDDAIAKGTGLQQFQKDFERIVAKYGWTGWTGEGSAGGRAWRAKVIYQTNMATSYAAGRFKQLSDPDLLKILPYWRYHHNDSVMHPRPLHVSWDGLTLPPDHPFWETHYPPNGWGCQCWVSAVSKADFMTAIANGKGPANAPDGTEGIDRGFGYAPGASLVRGGEQTALQDFAVAKINSLPPELAQALAQDIAPLLADVPANSIDNIITLVMSGKLTVDAAKALARKLSGFVPDWLAKIDGAPHPNPLPPAGEGTNVAFAGFDPGQARVEAGNPDGGEWTAEGNSGAPIQAGHHTLTMARPVVRETEKAVAIDNAALKEARATAHYDVKELDSSQVQMLRDNAGQGTLTWLPKSQISTHQGHVVGMAPWLASKQGFATKENMAAKAAAFDAGSKRYADLLAQAKAAGVKGVRVGMRTTTIKEKMRAHGMQVDFADDDEGLDFMIEQDLTFWDKLLNRFN